MRRRTVAVIGPGEACTNHEAETAYALGRALAEEGWVVVTGGRPEGVMDAASRGAREAGGLAVGILGGVDPEAASPHVDVVIPSGLGEARNAVVVMSGEVVVACGISPGTSAEVGFALAAQRPLVLLAQCGETLAFVRAVTGREPVVAETVDDAVQFVRQHLDGAP
jgi:uncharacterized protein (TIGR00725 family)